MTAELLGSILLTSMLALFCIFPTSGAVIKVENDTKEIVYLQPEDSLGFRELKGSVSYVQISAVHPVYYRFVDGQSNFHSIFVEGNDTLIVKYDGKRVTYRGLLQKENEFLEQHCFNARTPENIIMYSKEWVSYNDQALSKLYSSLDSAGLGESFQKIQKLYYRNIWLQQLMSVKTMNLFGHGNMHIDADYFDFLKNLFYEDEEYAFVPNWFSVMTSTFEEMERQGFIETTPADYMARYAARITSPALRSHYLLKLLQFVLQKGYADDYLGYINNVKPLLTKEDMASIPSLIAQFENVRKQNAKVLRGTPMTSFVAQDIDGKSYQSDDFKGKLLVIDFWFTGCVPCRAEMPYLDRLSLKYKGQPIQFLSVSLDAGEQLMGKWREMITHHRGDTQVLFLNLPNGFKNPFTSEMNIRSVPRIMLIGQDGKIIDSYAKRPSDPKLEKQLDALLELIRQK